MCIFIIFSSIFGILIYQVNKIELEYIRALIRFNSKPFEIYLKSLFELKKKIMDTNLDDDLQAKGDDEEKELLIKEDDSAHVMDNNKKQQKKSQIFENQIVKLTNMADSKKGLKTKDGESISKKEDNMRHKKNNNRGKKKGKNVGIKQLKIKAMSKYFKQMNLFFIVKIVVIFFLTFSYFFVLIILEDYYEKILLNLDEVINEIEGVYKDGFHNLILLKNITINEIEFEIEKKKAKYSFDLSEETYKINNIVYSKDNISNASINLEDPSKIVLNDLKLGNSLMTILNDESIDQNLQEKLNILYNGDSCKILFLEEIKKNLTNIISQKDYDDCTVFWSAILIKGMEQSMTQMIIEKNSVVDELTALYRRDKNITEIMDKNSSYRRFEFFLLFYFLRSFWKTSDLFDQIKEIKIKNISKLYIIITIVYIGITMILILIVRHVIRKSRKVFNSFLNFIVILPAKFLGDDSYFLEEILKLEDKLY